MQKIQEIQTYPLHNLPPYVDELVDITCNAFPMHVPVAPYLGSLRVNEIEYFERLEETGGAELAKFDLQRGIIINIKFNGCYNLLYVKLIRDICRDNPSLCSVLDPVVFSYPNEAEGDEPIADISMIYEGHYVMVAGTVIPCFEDQDNIRYCSAITLQAALLLIELVYGFAGVATDNGYRPINY